MTREQKDLLIKDISSRLPYGVKIRVEYPFLEEKDWRPEDLQGSSHYKQHCKDGYCILQWLNKAKKWNVRYNTEVDAWMELPKYNE